VAGTTKFQVLAARVVKGLAAAMKPDEVGLFEWTPAGEPQLIFGLSRSQTADAGLELVEGLTIDHEGRLLLEQARSRKRAVEGPESVRSGGDALAFAVPLLAGSDFLGVLYLAGRTTSISLDSSDLVFLEALATQVAVALDRARLAEQQRLREEQERIRLLDEVEKLRAALGRTRLLHLSASMETLLGTVRQVAPTDATVLITGESGTGKEVVARVVHTLSRRHDRPFVVVDCGAIPTTLIESELFGHEKGAFTGAQQRQVGRLVEAHGGTLLLDEIGELPLEAQTKLLRFVQEKQVRAMGGGAARTVDVRILAATNRELLAEVQAGRFRADLYHRLNVVRLEVPPLRARPDDILLLARHFIGTHEVSYGKGPLSVSKDAEALLLRHSWPGNVRELQNRLMRAVILCQGSVITPADLDLSESASAPGATNDAIRGSEALNERAEIRDASGRAKSTRSVAPSEDGIWQDLRDGLGRQIEKALENAAASPPPLGRWLAEDLVLEAEGAAGGVASRAAALLGMPETTFRRQLEGSAGRVKAGWSPRPADWQAVRAVLARLVRLGEAIGGSLPKQAQQVLLEEVLARLPHEPGKAAALLGVTLPTFRRRGAGPASPSRRDSS
jgi:DNA-binding NtrC family response regulator